MNGGRFNAFVSQAAEKVPFAIIPSPGRGRDKLREESLFDLTPINEGSLGEKHASV